jgi:hypothetical protein
MHGWHFLALGELELFGLFGFAAMQPFAVHYLAEPGLPALPQYVLRLC